MKKADLFYKAALQFFTFFEKHKLTYKTMPELIVILMDLYKAGLQLPNVLSYKKPNATHNRVLNLRIADEVQTEYRQLLFPTYENDEPVGSDFYDDFYDIADDLDRGMTAYEAGDAIDAVFRWRQSFNLHTNSHIIGALTALHALYKDYLITAGEW